MSDALSTVMQFVSNADLPSLPRFQSTLHGQSIEPVPQVPLIFDSGKDQAWVVGPQIFAFVKGVTAERREMIANSALFASLAADATKQRTDVRAWYAAYTNALIRLGWVLQESVQRQFDQEHQGSTVHEAVLEFVAALGVGGTALSLVTATLNAMQKADDNKPWITLFDRQTNSENLTGFQVGLVSQDATSDFQIKLMSFALELKQTNTQVLFLKFDTFGVHMNSVGSTVTVSDSVLREALPAIKERLKLYVRSYVSEVQLPTVKEAPAKAHTAHGACPKPRR